MPQPATASEITEANWKGVFDPAIVQAVQADPDERALLQQKLLVSLVTSTVEAWRSGSQARRQAKWKIALLIPLAAAAAYGVIGLINAIVSLLLPAWSDLVLYATAGIVVWTAFRLRSSTKQTQIDLLGSPLWKRLRLGRLEVPFDQRRIGWTTICLATLLGLQAGLIQFSSGHAGVTGDCDFRDSVLLTFDNLLHGVLLDAGELYGLRLGRELEHSTLSATVFLVFRLAYDLLVGLSVYLWYRGRELQKLVHDFPHDHQHAESVCLWIDDVIRSPEDWVARYGVECVFLQMIRAFLADRQDDVIELNHVIPVVRMTPRVRGLFVDSFGTSLLPVVN